MSDVRLEDPDKQARGMRLLVGETAFLRRKLLDTFFLLARNNGYNEVVLPSVEPLQVYLDKAGDEVKSQTYIFKDKKDRDLCLRPEGTATCQILANTIWKNNKDVKIFYETKCWRYEKPQAGRYREFTQFGVEILNPTQDYRNDLLALATSMVSTFSNGKEFSVSEKVKRGLAYYVEDGFEISFESLGAQKQVCGGGTYKEGIGFAIGVDRLMLVNEI